MKLLTLALAFMTATAVASPTEREETASAVASATETQDPEEIAPSENCPSPANYGACVTKSWPDKCANGEECHDYCGKCCDNPEKKVCTF